MPAITAAQIKAENDWDGDDISDTNLEYLIDNAINHINLLAGLSMSNLSGAAGSKTVTLTSSQEPYVKMLSALLVRAYIDKGPDTNVAAVSATTISTDPHYKLFMRLINQGIQYLRGRDFERV